MFKPKFPLPLIGSNSNYILKGETLKFDTLISTLKMLVLSLDKSTDQSFKYYIS